MERTLDEIYQASLSRHKPAPRRDDSTVPKSSTCIGIFSLSGTTTKKGLRHFFQGFGEVLNVRLILHKDTGKSKRFAFITFLHEPDARNAVEKINGAELDGSRVRVDFAYADSIKPAYEPEREPVRRYSTDGILGECKSEAIEFGKTAKYPMDARSLIKREFPEDRPPSPTVTACHKPKITYFNPEYKEDKMRSYRWRKGERAGYPDGFDPREEEVSVQVDDIPSTEYDYVDTKRRKKSKKHTHEDDSRSSSSKRKRYE